MTIKNNAKKFISALVIVSIILPSVLFSRPKKAEAFIVHDPIHNFATIFNGVTETGTLATSGANTALHIKDIALEILKEIARTFAKRLLQQMTKATVAWINTGFHGAPLFVENPGSFFKDIAKTEVKSLVTLFGYDPNRYPFGADFAQNLVKNYQRQLADNAAYTLSDVLKDPVLLNNYRNNFNAGGWNGFLINTQYPQNNYLGFQMIATQEVARRLVGTADNAATKVKNTLQQGMGFLSPKTCPSNPYYNNGTNEFQRPTFEPPKYTGPVVSSKCRVPAPGDVAQCDAETKAYGEAQQTYNVELTNAQDAFSVLNTCPGGLQATTPGSVVGNQIMTAMSSSFRKTELGAAVGGSISAILDALLNKFFDTVTGGLTGSGTKSVGNETVTGDKSPGTCSTGGVSGIPLPDLKTRDDCTSLGGTWTSTTGTPTLIPTDICTLVGGTSITTQANCNAIGGTWGTPPPLVYGFCIVGGNSTKTTEDVCTLASGTWGTTAPTGNCDVTVTNPITGETTSTTTTQDITQEECATSGGEWKLISSTPPTPPIGNCDVVVSDADTTTTTSSTTTKEECTTKGGTWTSP
jgi:hypothetical protein